MEAPSPVTLLQIVALALPAVAILLQAVQQFQDNGDEKISDFHMEYRFVEVCLLLLTAGALFFTAEIILSTNSLLLRAGLVSVFLGLLSILPVAYLGIRRGVKSVENPEKKLSDAVEKSAFVLTSILPVLGIYLFWDSISRTVEGLNRDVYNYISEFSSPIEPRYLFIAYVSISAIVVTRYYFQILTYQRSIQYEKEWAESATNALEHLISHIESAEVESSPPSNTSEIVSSLEALATIANRAPADIDDELIERLDELSRYSHRIANHLTEKDEASGTV